MHKYLCEECMHENYVTEENTNSPFPSFSIVGGIFGTVATLVTGALILVPIAIIAGVGADIVAKCESCGSEENVYEAMSTEEDEDGRSYSPLNPIGGEGETNPYWTPKSEPSPKPKYRYSEEESKLIPTENQSQLLEHNSNKTHFDWSLPSEQSKDKSVDLEDHEAQEKITPTLDEPNNILNENLNSEKFMFETVVPSIPDLGQKGTWRDSKTVIKSELGEMREAEVDIVNTTSPSEGEE